MTGLLDVWEVSSSAPGACAAPSETDGLDWIPARVPGTAAAAIGVDERDFDAEDWWFRTRFERPEAADDERLLLELDGVATVAEVYLNGELLLESSSMWARHQVDVTAGLAQQNELMIACRALKPLMGVRRRPAARWRTRVVNEGNLRWFRTMIFGRSPGFAPTPAPVGPWRPVRIVRRAQEGIDRVSLRTGFADGAGLVHARVKSATDPARLALRLGDSREPFVPASGGWAEAQLRIPSPARWWPHTHGDPVLHEATIENGGEPLESRRVGFRSLQFAHDVRVDGLDLRINGIPVFARGAVWTPPELVSMAPTQSRLRLLLEQVRDAGMNMLRVVGTGAYESSSFYELCDELGILVWQDLMFANLDYPVGDPAFSDQVESEVRQLLSDVAGRPSLVAICGNSEVEQQAAMLGLEPDLGRDQLWERTLPELISEARLDCAYLPSTPCGGDLPFHSDTGISHYFGVSGYFRPPDDARRADVKFAAECLAFANVPDEVEVPVHHPQWKAGVARDAGTGWDLGAGWDFDDVRDAYLRMLFSVDPVQLRRSDHERYLELSRLTSGEVMAEVIGEWRRAASPCRGALVLWLKDMLPGAGLGVIDQSYKPKVPYHYLRRAMAPIAVWTSDEGVNGVAIHVANDRPEPLSAQLRVALYRGLETVVAESTDTLALGPHQTTTRTVEGVLRRFVDAAWAYRFGPAGHDAIFVTLTASSPKAKMVFSQAVRFPAGLPIERRSAAGLGIEARASQLDDGAWQLALRSQRVAYGVRVDAPGFIPDDDALFLEPGRERLLHLSAGNPEQEFSGGSITAANLDGQTKIEVLGR